MKLKTIGGSSTISRGAHHVRVKGLKYLEDQNGENILNKNGDIGIVFTFQSVENNSTIDQVFWFPYNSNERYYVSRKLIKSMKLDNRENPIEEIEVIGKELWIIVREVWSDEGTKMILEVFDTSIYNNNDMSTVPAVDQDELIIHVDTIYDNAPDVEEIEKNDKIT